MNYNSTKVIYCDHTNQIFELDNDVLFDDAQLSYNPNNKIKLDSIELKSNSHELFNQLKQYMTKNSNLEVNIYECEYCKHISNNYKYIFITDIGNENEFVKLRLNNNLEIIHIESDIYYTENDIPTQGLVYDYI